MVRGFLGLSLAANIILWIAAVTLSKDSEANNRQVCVPIYSQSGLECVEGGCVNK